VRQAEGEQQAQKAPGCKMLPPKTDRSRRVVVLPGFAVQALRAQRAAQAQERLLVGRRPRWTCTAPVCQRCRRERPRRWKRRAGQPAHGRADHLTVSGHPRAVPGPCGNKSATRELRIRRPSACAPEACSDRPQQHPNGTRGESRKLLCHNSHPGGDRTQDLWRESRMPFVLAGWPGLVRPMLRRNGPTRV
jgi:hypothetical protein